MLMKHMAVLAVVVSAAVPLTMRAQDAKPAAPAQAAQPAAPRDARTVLAAAAKAMGVDSLKTIQYSGSGSNAGIGQNRNPDADWPLVRVKSYVREIDFAGPSSRTQIVRLQNESETTQEQVILPASPWGTQYDVWLSPFAFLKGAIAAGNATLESKTVMGLPYSVVTFMVQNKYKVSGYIDDKNMVYKVETWVDNAVLGDMLVEAIYADYKDYTGVKVPTTVINKQGGGNTLLLIVTDVKPNAAVNIQAPQQVQAAAPAVPVMVQTQKIANGVYYLMGGTHHSVVVEFADHLAVIEAPQNEARSLAVIKEIRKSLSKKPIRYIINTHHHFDHSGGLRTYVEEGATVVTQEINKAFYGKVLSPSAPRTLNPDSLALEKKKIPTLTIETVTDKKVLMDKTRTLELHLIKDSPHNDGILMAYLPAEKILVEVDVYTPPAANAPPATSVSPSTTNLVANIERLKLDVEKILPLHGPGVATRADLYKAAGKAVPASTAGN
jgi:glyoxylase-like metal-dependent hydrolase (beta-lactamase superfamily II)